MMLIYMKHPQHGLMPVYSERVKQENLSNGWHIIDWPPAETSVTVDDPLEVHDEPKRRGRPPKVTNGDG
jgi:hypothetical protein